MKRSLLSFSLLVAIAAGCSASGNYYFADGGDGGNSTITPGGSSTSDGGTTKKKDSGTTIEEDDASVTTTDASVKKDTSTTTTTDCNPGSISGFSPTWKPPALLHQNKCTIAQVDKLLCLFDAAANATTCQADVDDAANTDCFNCIYTASTATALGPIVIENSLGSLNMAGCIARTTGNVTSSGCGAKVQAADQCGEYSCSACPVIDGDDQSLADHNDCTDAASTSSCQTYTTDASCADALLVADGGAAACVQGNTFLDRGKALAKLFCVP